MRIKRILRAARSKRGKYLVELQELEDGAFRVEASVNGKSQLTSILYSLEEAVTRYMIEFKEGVYAQETVFLKEGEK
jgi:hypothetical protein